MSTGPRYQIRVEIARGGMGRVLEATDTRLGRVIALKEALATDRDSLRRFEREMRITARLEHPSIVPLYDAGETPDGTPFYAMRKVSGRPLDELVARATTLPERLALLHNVLAAAQAVAHAHVRGVLHRDLKPSNILVGDLGETVVIDWGLAKVIGDADDDAPETAFRGDSLQTRTGAVIGTPGFMAPEQRGGELADARSDVHALGATLYYVLARRPPYARTAPADARHEPLHEVVAGVPAELLTIVDKALAPERTARYLDAGGLAEDLQHFLDGQLVASHRYTAGERALRFLRRHRFAAAVAALALVVVGVIAALAVTRVIDARDRMAAALHDSRERNDQLVIEHARSLVATNPTLAVALVKPMAAAHWRGARAVGIAARLAGVARSLPGSPRTMSLELARDGVHAVAGGDDGIVRFYDLTTGATRVIARFPDRMHVKLADADRRVVAWYDRRLAIVDVAGATTVDVPSPIAIAALRGVGGAAWLVGHDGSVWRLELDAPVAMRVALPDEIWLIEPSPSGATIALGGIAGLWLVRDGEPRQVARGHVAALQWSRGGDRLVAAVGDRVLELARDGAIVSEHAYAGARAVAWQAGAIYVGARGRVTRLAGDAADDIPIAGDVNRLVLARDDSVLALSDADAFTVIQEHALAEIPPASALDAVTASPAGRFVIGGSDGRILVWDLDAVLPRMLAEGVAGITVLAAGELLVHAGAASRWLDPVTRRERPVELPAGELVTAASRTGTVIAIERATGLAVALAAGAARGTRLDGSVAAAAFVADDRIVAALRDGEVRLYQLPALTWRTLATLRARPVAVAATTSSVIVELADHAVWRHELASGAELRLPAVPEERQLAALPGGEVLVVDQREVRGWRRDGTLVHHAALEAPGYGAVRVVDARHALFGTADTGASLVDVAGRVTIALPPGSRLTDWDIAAGFLLARAPAGRLALTDVFAAGTWQLARPTRGRFEHATLASDARHAFALADGALLVWTLDAPTPAGTEAAIARLTDATASPTGNLVWP